MEKFLKGTKDILKMIGGAVLLLIGALMAGIAWLSGTIAEVILDAGEELCTFDDTEDKEETEEVKEPET